MRFRDRWSAGRLPTMRQTNSQLHQNKKTRLVFADLRIVFDDLHEWALCSYREFDLSGKSPWINDSSQHYIRTDYRYVRVVRRHHSDRINQYFCWNLADKTWQA